MQKLWLVVVLVVLCAIPCFGQAPSAAPLDLAAALGLSGGDNFAVAQSSVLFLAGGGTGNPSNITCTATCGSDPSVSCTVASGTCTAVNRSCPSQRGSVTCGGITTSCASVCAVCTEGATRTFNTNNCCGTLVGTETDRCVNGKWQLWSTGCGTQHCQF
jgi:hypothetical protein